MFDTTGGDSVKRKLSPWCKEVKKTLIDRDMTVTDLCDQVGMCRNYVSRTINGASYAPALAETISKALDINTEKRRYFAMFAKNAGGTMGT